MAITASQVDTNNTLEQFRVEFNKLRNDVSSLEAGTINYTAIAATEASFGELAVTGTFAVTTFQINGRDLIFEGATADAFETTVRVVDPTADRTVTIPDLSGTVQLQGQNLLVGDGGSIGSTSANNSINIGADGIVTFNNGVSGIAVASSVLLDATDGSNSDEGDNIVQNTAADENTNINYENATDDVFLYRYIDIERDGQLEKHSRMLHERTTQDRMITLILEDATENDDKGGEILYEDATSDIQMETEFPFTKFTNVDKKPTLIAEQGYGGIDLVELEFAGDNIILEEATIDGENFNNVLSVGNITTEGDVVYRTPNIATGGQFTTSLTFAEPTANRTITIPQETGTVITTGSIDAITESMMANDSVSSVELKTLSTLLIKNSSGSTLKTVHGAGA
tara:strand:- start:1612 stop:2805 length:1194 start_codon:yes stop_codon:yes gene_type:complete